MKRVLACFLLFLTAGVFSGGPSLQSQGLLTQADRSFYDSLLTARRAEFPSLREQPFGLLSQARDDDERDALLFLLATSPLSDLVDHDASFLLANMQATLETRKRTPWGNRMPDADFLHFVLPLRTGSEAADSFRLQYGDELLRRVYGLSTREAVLEINHWCHEHVTYAPSDARTRAPLATMRNAKGRCGEESVFTTSALRAAGIPARQVYVPRWAHADDNHAWVEAWVDGAWHFLGACEPDVDLDHAWFTEPARRAMLTAALVQGRYPFADEVLAAAPMYTRINTLPVYAPTRLVTVKVLDRDGSAVTGAQVDFRIYNYAEFFPVASARTDATGTASLRTGFGDLLVWAHAGEQFALALYSRERGDTLQLTLSDDPCPDGTRDWDVIPPPPVKLPVEEHPRAAETAMKVQRGDSLRGLYEARFLDSSRVAAFAAEHGYPADSCWALLRHARGNGAELLAFLSAVARIDRVPALTFLHTLAEKDLQDAPPAVLLAHYEEALRTLPSSRACDSLFMEFVAAPRIGREELRPWRKDLRERLQRSPIFTDAPDDSDRAFRIARWVKDSVRLDRQNNWGIVPQPVLSTFDLRTGDAYSRRLLLVALCRAAGIPARLHPATGAADFYSDGDWRDAGLDAVTSVPDERATLLLSPREGQSVRQPEYARHFTLARFEDGIYRTLDYEGDPVFTHWPARLALRPGRYALVTGNRQPDGAVLASMAFFTLATDETREVSIRIRDDDSPPVPLGRVDAGLLPEAGLPATVFLAVERGTEPVSHALLDLASARDRLAELQMPFVLEGREMPSAELADIASRHLPPRTSILPASGGPLHAALAEALHLPRGYELPLIAVIDGDGQITYAAHGYTIGAGEQILRILSRMGIRVPEGVRQ